MNDPVLLSRIQFAITAGFHFLFPPISIGLAWILVIFEWLAWRKKDAAYEQAARFFAALFALTFAMGVATGIVLEFQFGMNWAVYSKFVGDIFGAPLAAEALSAFFLESSFLGLYLLGRSRVPRSVHWFSILMVAVGATVSAFWIIAANSWQQTPAGYVMRNGRAELVDFWGAVFNPSTLPRFFHVIAAALVSGAFFVIGVSAYILRRNSSNALARRSLAIGVLFGLASALLTAFPTGDRHAQQVAQTQPEKFAVIEGLYQTKTHAPLLVFGLVKTRPPEIKAKVELPFHGLLSLMAFGRIDAEVKGIDAFPEQDIPPLWLPFVSFHNMVALGMLFILLTAVGAVKLRRGTLFESRKFLTLLFCCSPLPLVANQFGWVAAEVGRQPWIVYHMLRTSEAVSPGLTAGQVWFSMTALSLLYLALLVLYLFLLFYKMNLQLSGKVSSKKEAVV